MTSRDPSTLERRALRTTSALNLFGVLASANGLQALLTNSSRRQFQVLCKRAIESCREMARGISGAAVDPTKARDHLERLEQALVRDDVSGLQLHAAGALKALGFSLPPRRRKPGVPSKSRSTRGGAATRPRRKRRK
jgi:hypothetical protein